MNFTGGETVEIVDNSEEAEEMRRKAMNLILQTLAMSFVALLFLCFFCFLIIIDWDVENMWTKMDVIAKKGIHGNGFLMLIIFCSILKIFDMIIF